MDAYKNNMINSWTRGQEETMSFSEKPQKGRTNEY